MRALTLLAIRAIALESGRSEVLTLEEMTFIRGRPTRALMSMASRQRVVPLLAASQRDFEGVRWGEAARRAYGKRQRRCMSLASLAARVMHATAEVGARPLLVKGMALASVTNGDFCSRGVGDIDIAVAPERSQAAVAAIVGLGGRVRAGQPVDSEEGARRSIIHSRTIDIEGSQIDLHHRLDRIPTLMRIDHDELFSQRAVVDVGGVELDTLGLVDSTVLAACHSGRDAWSHLRSVLDMVRLLRLVVEAGELASLVARAAAQNVTRRLVLADEMCRPLSGGRELGAPGKSILVPQMLARASWRRMARGECVRRSDEPTVRAYHLFHSLASTGDPEAWYWRFRSQLPRR